MRPLASCVNSTLISRIWSPVSTSGAGATTPISPRERALTCLATDVLNQTLGDSLALHVRLALAESVPVADIHATLLLVSEYGLGKAWQSYDAVARVRNPPAVGWFLEPGPFARGRTNGREPHQAGLRQGLSWPFTMGDHN